MTMRLPASLLVAALALLLAVPAQAQQQTPAERAEKVAGCYILEVGSWSDPKMSSFTQRLRLDTMRFTARRMLPAGASAEERREATESHRLEKAFLAYRSFERKWKSWQEWKQWKTSKEGVVSSLSLQGNLWRMEGPDPLSWRARMTMACAMCYDFRLEGDTLRGRATSYSDTGLKEPAPSAPVVGRPVPCPSPDR